MATFPGAIFAPSTKVDGVDFYLAAHMNDAQNEIIAAQTAIGQEGNSGLVEGRLTLTTGVPVTTADVTHTTIYFTPFRGARLALHDGTGWVTHILTQISIAVPNTTATMYDVFVYSNAGTPTLEALVWTNDTTRATALTTLDGVYVKTGATTRRYLGSFRTDDNLSANCTDTLLRRYLWNYYNRVIRSLTVVNSTSHTYNTSTWRPFNNNQGASQVAFIQGVLEEPVSVGLFSYLDRALSSAGTPNVGAGLDTITGTSTQAIGSSVLSAGYLSLALPACDFFPAAGYHYLCLNQNTVPTGATAPTYISGTIFARLRG